MQRLAVLLLHGFDVLNIAQGSRFSLVIFTLDRCVVRLGLSDALIYHPGFRLKELLVERADFISMLGVFFSGCGDHQIDQLLFCGDLVCTVHFKSLDLLFK
jgi:hypothetical protein